MMEREQRLEWEPYRRVMDERAGALWQKFRQEHPERGNFGKNWYASLRPTAAIQDDLAGLDLPLMARDGDCIPVAEQVRARLAERGRDAVVVWVTGWVDREAKLLGFMHAAVLTDGTVVDATATQFDATLPPLIVASPEEYARLLGGATGLEVTLETRTAAAHYDAERAALRSTMAAYDDPIDKRRAAELATRWLGRKVYVLDSMSEGFWPDHHGDTLAVALWKEFDAFPDDGPLPCILIKVPDQFTQYILAHEVAHLMTSGVNDWKGHTRAWLDAYVGLVRGFDRETADALAEMVRPHVAKTAAITWSHAERDKEGERSHITLDEKGTIPTSVVANMPGRMGEVPGEHRNMHGERWEEFKADIAARGIQNGIFITVDWDDQPYISEGNHRRDAAVELGLAEVPVQIRYFGHAERQGTVLERAGLGRTASWSAGELIAALVGDSPELLKALWAHDPQEAIADDLGDAPPMSVIEQARAEVQRRSVAWVRQQYGDRFTVWRGGAFDARGNSGRAVVPVTPREETARFFARGGEPQSWEINAADVVLAIQAWPNYSLAEEELLVPVERLARTASGTKMVTLYHGTPSKNLDSILGTGLRENPEMPDGIWLVDAVDRARRYAKDGDDPGAVFEVTVPEEWLQKERINKGFWTCHQPIPPAAIRRVASLIDTLEAQQVYDKTDELISWGLGGKQFASPQAWYDYCVGVLRSEGVSSPLRFQVLPQDHSAGAQCSFDGGVTITLRVKDQWAVLNEAVALHEVAHAIRLLRDGDGSHGSGFVAEFSRLMATHAGLRFTAKGDEVLLWRGDAIWEEGDIGYDGAEGIGNWWGNEALARFYGQAEGVPPSGGERWCSGAVVAAWWPRDAIQGDLEAMQVGPAHEGVLVQPGARGRVECIEVWTANGWKKVDGPRTVTATRYHQPRRGGYLAKAAEAEVPSVHGHARDDRGGGGRGPRRDAARGRVRRHRALGRDERGLSSLAGRIPIRVTKQARRQHAQLDPPVRSAVTRTVKALSNDPVPAKAKSLVGEPGGFRITVAKDWRVLYIWDGTAIKVYRVMHRSEVYRRQGAKVASTFGERLGRCYELAGREVMMDRSGIILVHGSIEGFGNPRIGHAWVIRPGGTVYDPVLDQEFEPEHHRDFFDAREHVRYTSHEARVEMVRHEHWGPWHDAPYGLTGSKTAVRYERSFNGYNATLADGSTYMVRRTDEALDGVRGPWWTVIESDPFFTVPLRSQEHPDHFPRLADAKEHLAEVEAEMQREAAQGFRFEVHTLDHDRGLEVTAYAGATRVGSARFTLEDNVAEAIRLEVSPAWRRKKVYQAIHDHVAGLGYEVTHRLPLGDEALRAMAERLRLAVGDKRLSSGLVGAVG
jgi:mRNA interferase RelE/StbE